MGSAQSLSKGVSHLGIRTVVKLANRVAARVGRSLMVPVFSRTPSKRCSKTMNADGSAAESPAPLSGANKLAGPSGRL